MILLWSLLACEGAPPASGEAIAEALAPGEDLAACAALAFEEMQVLCRVQVAAKAGQGGDTETAQAACDAIPEGAWREECHFRAGEELGKRGLVDRALRHCAQAGQYARFCLTHAAWGMPPLAGIGPDSPPEQVAAAMDEFSGLVHAGLAGADPEVVAEGVAALRARAWFHQYVGTGRADPAAAKAAPEGHAADARTAFAFEAARLALLEGMRPESVMLRTLLTWDGEATLPEGPIVPPERRVGRFSAAVLPDQVRASEHAQLFGGGARLVAEDPQEDLEIALLEGLYHQESVPAAAFLPWLSDPRDRVRWTATKCYVLAGGLAEQPDLADTLDDPVQRAYVGLSRQHARRGGPAGGAGGKRRGPAGGPP